MWWLTSAGNYYTGPIGWSIRFRFDSGRQMHCQRHGTHDPVRVMHEPDEITDRSLTHQINDTIKPWMPVRCFAALYELNASGEVIHDLLILNRIPPLGGKIVLSACDDDPVTVLQTEIIPPGIGFKFVFRHVQIATKPGDRNTHVQKSLKILRIAVDEVVRQPVGVVDQWIVHIHNLNIRIALVEWREVWIVDPQIISRCANVRRELTGMGGVEISHGGGHHEDVAGALKRFENQSPHRNHHELCRKAGKLYVTFH